MRYSAGASAILYDGVSKLSIRTAGRKIGSDSPKYARRSEPAELALVSKKNRPKASRTEPVADHPTNWGKILSPLFLLLLFAASATFKVYKGTVGTHGHLPYHANDDSGYFWSESATQYRYAKLASAGVELPAIDTVAQYPEGVVLRRDMTVFMETLCGVLHRLFAPGVPLHLFAISFLALASSLSVFAVFMVARLIGGSYLLACLAAAYFAFSPLAFGRTIGSFEYESFASPILYLSFAVFCLAIRQSQPRLSAVMSALSGLLLVVALLSWHLVSFLSFALILVVSLYSLTVAPSEETAGNSLRSSLLVIGAIVISSGLLIPALRVKALVFSTLAAAILAYWICCALQRWLGKLPPSPGTGACYLALTAVTAVLLYWLNPEKGMYGHVVQLALSKLRFFLVKPSDPALLPFDARCLWVEAFNSPSLGAIFLSFFPALLFPAGWALMGLIRYLRRGLSGGGWLYQYDSSRCIRDVTYLMGIVAVVLYILVDRLSLILIFFVAVLLSHVLAGMGRRSKTIALIALVAIFGAESWSVYSWDKDTPEEVWLQKRGLFPLASVNCIKSSNIIDLIRWIRHGTQPDDPILAAFQTSPLLLTYANRPILLNPKFESASVRRKYKEFLRALYGSEDDLYRFATRYGAKYFVYQPDFIINTSSDSMRFVADQLSLGKDSAVLKFQFFPEQLKHFEFVHQNTYFRIYVVRSGDGKRPFNRPYYTAWYDPKLLNVNNLGTGPSREEVLAILSRINQELEVEAAADDASARGDNRGAAETLSRFLPSSIHKAWLTTDLAIFTYLGGNVRAGIDLLHQAVAADPLLPYARKQLSVVMANVGQLDAAIQEAQVALSLDAVDPELQELLGNINMRRREYAKALDFYQAAIRQGTNNPSLRGQVELLKQRLATSRN